ncbi:type II secretion system secretin GspD [Shewanella sp. 202IG2-18]|uniref:type II secretion system secretin GspD n=1 Tax=Parashewanella hymeniacidonis TaxID=2807618 RepID=UPI0019620F20|nr:type II secretion system secretin GspD [Parashewanella hymeniacidonis]MBM7071106.1 type II secretion system secretin GspD [Parashewanella hymeniacidonis]
MNNKKLGRKFLASLLAGAVLMSPALSWAAQYAANFKGTDIQEFINIVGKNLNKTIIVDPTVRGKINVRSYDLLNDEQYYQFFLNVLQVYGYAVVKMDNNIIKVIKDKDAKTSNIRVADDSKPGQGDEMVTRIVALYNTQAKQLAPLLRQLNDNAGGGNVVNYDPSNVLMISGRAAVVNKLVEIVRRVDKQGDTSVQVIPLNYASASEIVRIIETLYRQNGSSAQLQGQAPKVVADERTNSVVVSGDEKTRMRVANLVKKLDEEQATTGNTRVRYLRYAKAEDLVEVLNGFADKISANTPGAKKSTSARSRNTSSSSRSSSSRTSNRSSSVGGGNSDINIVADTETNSLVMTAQPAEMRTLNSVIDQLDIRRAQVLVQAIIVEIGEGDDVGLGFQWGTSAGGGTQFNNFGASIGEIGAGVWAAKDQPASQTCSGAGDTQNCTNNPDTPGDISLLASALGKINGAAWGVWTGDFGALVQAISSDTNSNVLSTPSITTLDNQEANFIVGDEVPVITGSTASSNNSNPFQTVERKEVGVKLKVTPQINQGGSAVKLTIEQEVSGVNGNTGVDISFSTRRLTTTVLANDGQVVVLGGLITENVQESVQKVPLLGDIPFLGHLFKSSSSKKTKRNLMVFIKPTIVRDGMTMNGLTGRKYNYFRALQIEQQDRGINLMPNTEVPVLEEWKNQSVVPQEVQDILQRHEEGKGLGTPMRKTDSTLKMLTESKEKDQAEKAKQDEKK